MSTIKSINGLAIASMKARNGLARASIKTIGGVDVPSGGGAPFGGAVSTTSLVDWWPLSEASGTRVGVHAGLNLTDNNTVTGGTGGPDGSDYSQFTAANAEYLNRASETALQIGSSSFTFCGWVLLDSAANGRGVAGKWLTNQFEWVIQFRGPATNRVDFYVATGITTPDTGNVATVALTTSNGVWYWVCAWYDSGAGNINLSINNGTAGTTSKAAISSSGSANFTIGRNDDAGAASPAFFYWDGRMQRMGFWKRVLTAGERTALYNSGNGLDY